MEKWLGTGWVRRGRVPFRPLVLLLYPFPLLVPSRLSLSLPSGARVVMGRREARERDDLEILCRIFPSYHPPPPHPLAAAERVTRRRLGMSQPHLYYARVAVTTFLQNRTL